VQFFAETVALVIGLAVTCALLVGVALFAGALVAARAKQPPAREPTGPRENAGLKRGPNPAGLSRRVFSVSVSDPSIPRGVASREIRSAMS
jgi:hypothetical protein